MTWRILLTIVLLAGIGLVGGRLAATQTAHTEAASWPLPLAWLAAHIAQPQDIAVGAQATPRFSRTAVFRTPTPSQAAAVDLSGAVLYLSDLPRGYREVPLEELGLTTGYELLDDLEIASSFAFMDAANVDLVYGLTVLLENADEVATFAAAFADPEAFADELTGVLETEEVQDMDITFPSGIGTEAVTVSFTAIVDEYEVRVTVVAFLRDIVGATVITMHLAEDAGRYAAEQGAAVLDGRIGAALSGLPTTQPVATPTPRPLRLTPGVTLTLTPRPGTPTATRTPRSLRLTPGVTLTLTPRLSTPAATATRTFRRTPTPGASG